MITRRTLVGSAGLVFAGILQGQNSKEKTGGSKAVFKHDLPDISIKHWALTAVEVTYGPGESSASHRHPGITVAYVLEGEIRSKVGDAPEQTYTVGQMFFENPNEIHAVSGNASNTKPAKLLALLFAEKGKPLTTAA
jgi:quercetin dioxygenase-like cupin family protein